MENQKTPRWLFGVWAVNVMFTVLTLVVLSLGLFSSNLISYKSPFLVTAQSSLLSTCFFPPPIMRPLAPPICSKDLFYMKNSTYSRKNTFDLKFSYYVEADLSAAVGHKLLKTFEVIDPNSRWKFTQPVCLVYERLCFLNVFSSLASAIDSKLPSSAEFNSCLALLHLAYLMTVVNVLFSVLDDSAALAKVLIVTNVASFLMLLSGTAIITRAVAEDVRATDRCQPGSGLVSLWLATALSLIATVLSTSRLCYLPKRRE